MIRNMSACEVLETITEETPIPIIVNNHTGIFLPKLYACGYHVYMNIWNATINDYLQCKIEEKKKLDPSAIVLLHQGRIQPFRLSSPSLLFSSDTWRKKS